ncbi:TetR/AcrR family transcriptional regulator [Roseovarius ramblicola]|uniref:TetR/AcrR family transcriptional regulator n=1 Tax=Roseovarius ramblicola TaxID=2022336 RepID=A0ABV5HWK0_9RHOB
MALISSKVTPDRPARLTGDDWIECALAVLVESGIEAVQITALARRLDVTRGSFYWHFESREALLDALLTEWRARNTGVMVEALEGTTTLDDGILALFSVWVDHRRFDPRLDQAVRDWARHSEQLRGVVKAEDAARVRAISAFYKRHEFDPKEAFIRARVIYFTQISYYALHLEEDEAIPERMSYLEAYFRSFTGRDIDPAIAAAYRQGKPEGHDE